MLAAGAFTQRVSMQRLARTVVDGELVEAHSAIGSRFAQIEAVGGGETRFNGQLHSEAQYLVRIPHDSVVAGLTTADRLAWSGRTLELLRITDRWSDRRVIELQAKERA